MFAGQGYSAQPACLHACLPAGQAVCWPGYSAQATAHPATCLPACLLARLLCPRYCTALPDLPACCSARLLPATCLLGAQATLPRLLNTLPPACLFAGKATLPRLMHTLPPACLPVCWQGYSAQATAHPATCLPGQAIVPRLLCPGYCTPCHLPAFAGLFAGKATLPRLLHTLPPACLSVFWTGYSAQATAHPATCLPACLLAGYSAQANAHPADCLPARLLARLLCPANLAA